MSQPYVLWTGIRVHGNLGRWELEHGDWGTKSEREIKESIPFTTATKRIKYLEINLPKETKYLYTENFKTLKKEINDTDGEIYPIVLGLEQLFFLKMTMLLKVTFQGIRCNSYQVTNCIFQRTRIKNFTIYMKTQKTPKSQSNRERKMELKESIYLTSDYTTK